MDQPLSQRQTFTVPHRWAKARTCSLDVTNVACTSMAKLSSFATLATRLDSMRKITCGFTKLPFAGANITVQIVHNEEEGEKVGSHNEQLIIRIYWMLGQNGLPRMFRFLESCLSKKNTFKLPQIYANRHSFCTHICICNKNREIKFE